MGHAVPHVCDLDALAGPIRRRAFDAMLTGAVTAQSQKYREQERAESGLAPRTAPAGRAEGDADA